MTKRNQKSSSDAGNESSVLVSYEELHDRWQLTRWNIRRLLEHRRKYPNDIDGNFPLPVKVGRQNFWKLSELREWATRAQGWYYHPSSPQWLERRLGMQVAANS
jgi:predicted DNA-binding transcriptional regulator AlpA